MAVVVKRLIASIQAMTSPLDQAQTEEFCNLSVETEVIYLVQCLRSFDYHWEVFNEKCGDYSREHYVAVCMRSV